MGRFTPHCGDLAASRSAWGRTVASSDTAAEGAARRVPGCIQRSISRSNTLSVPIQKIAKSTLPMTTPAQVCSQAMDLRKVSFIASRSHHAVIGISHSQAPQAAKPPAITPHSRARLRSAKAHSSSTR